MNEMCVILIRITGSLMVLFGLNWLIDGLFGAKNKLARGILLALLGIGFLLFGHAIRII